MQRSRVTESRWLIPSLTGVVIQNMISLGLQDELSYKKTD